MFRLWLYSVIAVSVLTFFNASNADTVFPFEEFLGIFSSDPVEEEIKQRYLCNGSRTDPTGDQRTQCCSCHETCVRFRTCCIDQVWDVKTMNASSLQSYFADFVENNTKKDYGYTCDPLVDSLFLKSKEHKTKSYFMVSQCLNERNSSLKSSDFKLCQSSAYSSMKEATPVISKDDNILYRSAACARCNGITKYRLVSIGGVCIGQTIDVTKIQTQECVFEIPEKSPYISKCDIKDIKLHCFNSSKYKHSCASYVGYIQIGKVRYRNLHCLKCAKQNTGLKIRFMKGWLSGDECFTTSKMSTNWKFLIDFNGEIKYEDSQGKPVAKGKVKCPADMTYDIFTNECTPIKCPLTYSMTNEGCQQKEILNATLNNCFFANTVYLYIISEITAEIMPVLDFIVSFLNLRKENLKTMYENGSLKVLFVDHFINDTDILINLQRNLQTLKNNPVKTILSNIPSSYLVTSSYGFDVTRAFYGQICAKPRQLNVSGFQFTQKCDLLVNNNTMLKRDYNLWIELNDFVMSSHISICDEFHADIRRCEEQTNVTRNYTIDENKTLTITDQLRKQYRYPPHLYSPTKSGIVLCLHSKQEPMLWWFDDLSRFVMYICLPLSILGYCCVIVTYSRFRVLRNIPGLNVLSMTTSLLLSDIMLIISSTISVSPFVCKALGSFTYWIILVSQMWILIIVVDLMLAIQSQTSIQQKDTKKAYITYFLTVSLTSLFFVIPLASLDEFGSILTENGEDRSMCWIKSQTTRTWSFIVPIMFAILLSMTLLIYTILTIKKQKQTTSSILGAGGQPNINLVKVALKLVLGLGLIDLIGFLQFPGSDREFNHVVLTIYHTTRNSRGIFVCFVYLFNKRVFGLYNSLFCTPSSKEEISNRHTRHTTSEF